MATGNSNCTPMDGAALAREMFEEIERSTERSIEEEIEEEESEEVQREKQIAGAVAAIDRALGDPLAADEGFKRALAYFISACLDGYVPILARYSEWAFHQEMHHG